MTFSFKNYLVVHNSDFELYQQSVLKFDHKLLILNPLNEITILQISNRNNLTMEVKEPGRKISITSASKGNQSGINIFFGIINEDGIQFICFIIMCE